MRRESSAIKRTSDGQNRQIDSIDLASSHEGRLNLAQSNVQGVLITKRS